MSRLPNKIILITGAARGQGAAEARRFVREGARVVITDILEAQGQELARELGKDAVFLRHDVSSETDWQNAVEAASAMGGLHGLINNAGIYRPGTLMETDAALFEQHMRINQLGPFLGMKAVVPLMERSGGGAIVNISSIAGLRGSPGAIAYSATKWALRGMTKAAAVDLAPRQHSGELRPPRPHRHANAGRPHAGAEPPAPAVRSNEAQGNPGRNRRPRAVPDFG